MAADVSEGPLDTTVQGLQTVLQSAARLSYTVATDVAEKTAYETEGMALEDGRAPLDVDGRHVHHETAAQMREACHEETNKSIESCTHHSGRAVSDRRNPLPGTAAGPSSEDALSRESPVSAAKSSDAAPEGSRGPHKEVGPCVEVPGRALADVQGSKYGVSPGELATGQLGHAAAGNGEGHSPDEEVPRSPSADTNSTSDTGGVADLSGSGAHSYRHYRVGKDVVLRLEYISPNDTRVSTCTCSQSCQQCCN